MADTDQDRGLIPRDICSCFMTKTMHLNTDHRRCAFEESLTADTALFHCLKTMDGIGPDEDDVLPERCRPTRSCHCVDVDS